MTIYILLIFFLIGFWFTIKLFAKLPLVFQLSLAVIIGFLFGGWLSWLISLILGYKYIILILTILTTFIYICKPIQIKVHSRFDWIWLLYTIFTMIIFYYLFYSTQLKLGKLGWYSTGPAWGDIPMHTSLISYFAQREKFDFNYPLLLGAKLSYPFMIDYISALFYRYGATIQVALILPTYLLTQTICQLIYYLVTQVFQSRLKAVVASAIFFLNGSFFAVYYFVKDYRISGLSFSDFIKSMKIDYTQIESSHLALMNIISSHILPQRGIVFGLSLIVILLLILNKFLNDKATKNDIYFVAILISLMPFIHIHCFLVAIYFSLIFVWILVRRHKLNVKDLYRPLFVFICISIPQLVWQLKNNPPAHFFAWRLGWLNTSDQNIALFWFLNLGLVLILLTCILCKQKYTTPNIFSYLFIPSILIFVVINIVRFQPNDFDNYKLYISAWLIFSVLIADLLVKLFRKGLVQKIGSILIFLFLILPGVLSITTIFNNSYILLSNEEITFAQKVEEAVSKDQYILTTSNHNNPVSMLSGRKVVMGYPGWLLSYAKDISKFDWIGINSLNVEKANQYMKNNSIKYIAVQNQANQIQLSEMGYKLLASSGDWKLYTF